MDNTLDPTIVALAKAIKYAETGTGNTYAQKGASGEFGAYQFMPNTYKLYAAKYLGSAVAKATVENQNRIAYSFIKSKKEQGYNPSQIASMWNAGEKKPDAYKQNWVGINSQGVKYDTPGYVRKVSAFYQQFKQPLQSQSNYEEPPVTSAFTNDNPVVEKSFLKKVGDFFTGGTQAFGKDIGEAVASGKNADMYSQAMDNYTQVQNNLQLEINKRLKGGQDATKLISTLQDLKSTTPKLEDFTGDTINKTTKQILGDAGMFALEATSGGLLSGGAKAVASKVLTTGQKVVQAGGIGAIYGGIGGATGAMQQNKSTGNIVLDSFVGGLVGFGLGAGLTAVGVGLSKGIGKTRAILNPTEKAFTNAQTNVSRAYEKTLNLTPSQRAKEQALLEKTGDNIYTTLVKNHINLGAKEADAQLANVMKLYEKGIEQAQKNEHGLFNLNEVVQNSFREINEKIPSETARQTAKDKIRKEVLLMMKNYKGTMIKNQEKQTLVDSAFMERLRKTGNSWTPFNASDPEKIGKSTGYALANSVRDNVEKYGTFPEYRNAMREWGKVIHVQQVLGKLEKSGKYQFRVLGGLSGAISRRILTGALGYHTGGLGGLIMGELGGEYGARVMSNPTLRTYLDRLIINNYDKKITPEVITKLANQIKIEIEKQNKLLKLPERTATKETLITPAPTTYEKPAQKIMNQSKQVDKAPITKQTNIIPSKANISNDITTLKNYSPELISKIDKQLLGDKTKAVVIDADVIKKLHPEYDVNNPSILHEDSSTLSKYLVNKAIDEDTSGVFKMIGGGSGSGKSEIVLPKISNTPSVIFDGTLGGLKSAKAKIDYALSKGKTVELHPVYTPPDLATVFNAIRSRSVDNSILIENHFSYRQTVATLLEEYGNKIKVVPYENKLFDTTRKYKGEVVTKDVNKFVNDMKMTQEEVTRKITDIQEVIDTWGLDIAKKIINAIL